MCTPQIAKVGSSRFHGPTGLSAVSRQPLSLICVSLVTCNCLLARVSPTRHGPSSPARRVWRADEPPGPGALRWTDRSLLLPAAPVPPGPVVLLPKAPTLSQEAGTGAEVKAQFSGRGKASIHPNPGPQGTKVQASPPPCFLRGCRRCWLAGSHPAGCGMQRPGLRPGPRPTRHKAAGAKGPEAPSVWAAQSDFLPKGSDCSGCGGQERSCQDTQPGGQGQQQQWQVVATREPGCDGMRRTLRSGVLLPEPIGLA